MWSLYSRVSNFYRTDIRESSVPADLGCLQGVQKSDAGVGIGTLVGANAPTPPYGGGLAPPTPPLMVGASAPTPPLSRPVGLPNG